MSGLTFKIIHTDINQFLNQIDQFLEGLDTEKKYFVTLKREMVLHSDLLIAAMDGERIVGMTGMVPHLFFHKAWIVVKEKYQYKGIGGFLYLKRHAEAKKRFNLVLSNVHPDNIDSLKLNHSIGSRNVGMRFGIQYMALAYSDIGKILFYLFIILFPMVTLWDRFKILFVQGKSQKNVNN